jgi:hypothetical protein
VPTSALLFPVSRNPIGCRDVALWAPLNTASAPEFALAGLEVGSEWSELSCFALSESGKVRDFLLIHNEKYYSRDGPRESLSVYL